MKSAAPFMSTFIIYLLGISTSWFSFKKFRQSIQKSRYLAGSLFLLLSLSGFALFFLQHSTKTIAGIPSPTDYTFPVPSNQPIGEAKGLNPGRVVWIRDPSATNEYYIPENGSNDFWYSDDNADEGVIYNMLALAITKYTGSNDLYDAWNEIFRSFNRSHSRGDVGYTSGEKIAFKINLTNQIASTYERPSRMDATPQLLNALLEQLVNVVGVAQQDITMGDPYRDFRSEYKELVQSRFPEVKYVDGKGGNGVHQTVPSSEEVLVFSDKVIKSTLPQQFLDAAYVINIPCLKSHDEGGITMIAKNHQGSFLEKGDDPKGQYAIKMHYSLAKNSRGMGKYRHTVDYMGHEQTGGKGLIYIIDGIWGGESWQGWIKKFKSDPFNNDYPNSILVSQDPVALESVCYDVLFHEYLTDSSKNSYPIQFKEEIADHLSQCASSNYWPQDIEYDPEGDGTPIGSLGVFEHWNNASDRQYSRNLGVGNGIELITEKSSPVNYCDSANIIISYHVTDATCSESDDGKIEIEVGGYYPEFTYTWSNGSAAKDIHNLAPGNYTVEISDSLGCAKSELIEVSAPKPILLQKVISEPSCKGDSNGYIVLDVSGGIEPYQFIWFDESKADSISGLPAGNYMITVVDGNDCIATDSIELVDPEKTAISEVTGADKVDVSHIYTYSVEDHATHIFYWIVKGGNVISGQGTHVVNIQWGSGNHGLISVIAESAMGCMSDTAKLHISINPSVVKRSSKRNISIYPNPASDLMIIDTDKNGQYSLEMSSCNGTLIFKTTLETSPCQIDLSPFEKGVYYLQIRLKDFVWTERVVKL